MARRLAEALEGGEDVRIGLAVYPEYQGGPRAMIEVARRQLLERTDAA